MMHGQKNIKLYTDMVASDKEGSQGSEWRTTSPKAEGYGRCWQWQHMLMIVPIENVWLEIPVIRPLRVWVLGRPTAQLWACQECKLD